MTTPTVTETAITPQGVRATLLPGTRARLQGRDVTITGPYRSPWKGATDPWLRARRTDDGASVVAPEFYFVAV